MGFSDTRALLIARDKQGLG